MTIEPKLFLSACYAGLVLAGQDEDKNPEWMGTDDKWHKYASFCIWFDECEPFGYRNIDGGASYFTREDLLEEKYNCL